MSDMTLILRFLGHLLFGYALKSTSLIETLIVFMSFVVAIFALVEVVEYLIALGRIGGLIFNCLVVRCKSRDLRL